MLLLVDDRDGRIVAELSTEEDALNVIDSWTRDDGGLPEYLSLVELRSHHGEFMATDSTVRVRPLT